MRYISHEIRTPLNAACLGIKILCDDLKKLRLQNLLDTAIDTEKSCKTAVDVLNDMLLFDKISSGMYVLYVCLYVWCIEYVCVCVCMYACMFVCILSMSVCV